MEREAGSIKSPVVFPFLVKEPKRSNQDAINQSFLTGLKRKLPEKQSRLIISKDGVTSNKNVLHGRERTLKGFHSSTHKEIRVKSYSCPNIVDMSSIVFYHERRARQERPRRIINGFFPNKIRSNHCGMVTDGANQNKGRAVLQPQVEMCRLGEARNDSATNFKRLGGSHEDTSNSQTSHHGPNSKFTCTITRHPERSFDDRRTQSCWPVRNGSPSPWLQRYKLKKRATSSYALQKPVERCNKPICRPKQNQEYVNLSSAVIFDAF